MNLRQIPRFGPAGNGEHFYAAGYKATLQAPGYLEQLGLNAYEYQCGRGVNVSEKTARALGEKAREHGVALSLHAPYYISMSGIEEEKRLGSIRYILESARAADWMGADRIIIHTGSCAKLSRADALALAEDTMQKALAAVREAGLSHIALCPETMGKLGQLGTLEEVLALCALDESMVPCIDFGHLNARTMGGLAGKEQYAQVLDTVENALGRDRAAHLHSHFSKIEYTSGGEKRHLTFADTVFGPEFEPLAELFAARGYTPTVICESAGTQSEDALFMKQCMEEKLRAESEER